jgi:hypothetical protein
MADSRGNSVRLYTLTRQTSRPALATRIPQILISGITGRRFVDAQQQRAEGGALTQVVELGDVSVAIALLPPRPMTRSPS